MRVLLMDLRLFLSESWTVLLIAGFGALSAYAFYAEFGVWAKVLSCGAFLLSWGVFFATTPSFPANRLGDDGGGSGDGFGDGGGCE